MKKFRPEDYAIYQTKEHVDLMEFDEYYEYFMKGFGLYLDDKFKCGEMKLMNKLLYDPSLDYKRVIEDYFMNYLKSIQNMPIPQLERKAADFILSLKSPYLSGCYLKFGRTKLNGHKAIVDNSEGK